MPQKQLSKKFLPKFLPKAKLYFLITFIAFSLFLLLLGINSYYQLRIIQIEGSTPKDHILGLDSFKGTNLYFLSTGSIIDAVNKNNPNILIDEVVKEFPDKIVLKIKYIEPIAHLKLNVGYAELSDEGKILKKIKTIETRSKQKDKQLPIINFYQQFDFSQIIPGNTLDYEEVVVALFLLKKCNDLDLKIESIDISGLNMIVFNLIDKKIIFSAEKDKDKLALELEAIIKQFKIEAKDFKILDLRFDKPIVRF